MGSHAKPRTTGRKAALGALALGASLSGVGLIAAALDPATAVLTANGTDEEGGATQLSGLSSPVSLDLTPAADSIKELTSAPVQSATTSAASAVTSSVQHSAPEFVSWFSKPTKSTTSASSTSGKSGSSGTETAVKPIVYSNPAKPTGSSNSGTHTVTGSGAPPTDTSGITSAIQDAVSPVTSQTTNVLPAVQNLVSQVPVVSTIIQDTGSGGTVSSLPLVGTLLGGSGLL